MDENKERVMQYFNAGTHNIYRLSANPGGNSNGRTLRVRFLKYSKSPNCPLIPTWSLCPSAYHTSSLISSLEADRGTVC